MKIMTIICAVALFVGCSESKKQDANHANEHMHQSSFEELVERFEDPERATWQKPELVIDLMNINADQTIADIGAGTGYFSFPIAKRGAKVVAIDVDEKFLQYITQKKDSLHKVEIRLSEYDDPLLALHEVDKALMVNVAHHIEKRGKYFNKVRKGLKVGGSFYIVDFKPGKLPVGPPPKHKVSAKSLTKDLALAGFLSVEIDSTSLDYQYIFTAK